MAKAKEKNKNSTKSFVMLIVTGVTLVAVTLCWFVMSNRTTVEEVKEVEVANEESSFANIYYGADATGKIAIRPDDIVEYIKITDNIITLENMFPGAEYTYRAEFSSAREGQKITLSFDGIQDKNGGNLTASVETARRAVLVTDSTEEIKYNPSTVSLNAVRDNPFEYTVESDGKYRVYYSFKIADATTSAKENMSIEINNVDAVLSDAQ